MRILIRIQLITWMQIRKRIRIITIWKRIRIHNTANNLRCLRRITLRIVPVRDARSFAYMTVHPVAVYSRIFPASRGSSIRGGQDNSVPLSIDLPDFSVSRSHSHPSDAFYYSVDVTPAAAVAAIWLPSLGSLSERHCRGRYGSNVTVPVYCLFNSCSRS
jgi:hypothetical protein